MRTPPAASWPVADDRRWRAVQALLHAAAAASACGWLARWSEAPRPVVVVAALAAAVVGGVTGWRAGRQRTGRLDWTGSQWNWHEPGRDRLPIDAPDLMLDLQAWMLLRWRPRDGGRRRWCSVSRDTPPGEAGTPDAVLRWTAFRAAVYSAASRTDGRSGPESPSP